MGTPSAGILYKDIEEGNFCSLPVCSCFASKPFSSLALHPGNFRIPECAEDKLGNAALWIEQQLDSWAFHS